MVRKNQKLLSHVGGSDPGIWDLPATTTDCSRPDQDDIGANHNPWGNTNAVRNLCTQLSQANLRNHETSQSGSSTKPSQDDLQNSDSSQSSSSYGEDEDTRGRVPRWPFPYSTAAQILFLPPEEPEELGLRPWGSDQEHLHPDAYNHPVLVLTDPDDYGYVVFQLVGSP